MGKIVCERHGAHPGILCCDHVREAVSKSQPIFSIDRYRVALSEDHLLEHLICVECAMRFSLSPQDPISEDVWEDEKRFPNVCPVCVACYSQWSESRGS